MAAKHGRGRDIVNTCVLGGWDLYGDRL